MKKLKVNKGWKPPQNWLSIKTIDAHTAGEPLRIICEGFPVLRGESLLAQRRFARQEYDNFRKMLMWEPRGHADMYGCILTPAVSPEADFGVLFLHNEGFSTMCGHGIIAVTKVVLETGLISLKDPLKKVKIDTPAGLVIAHALFVGDQMNSIAFENVPSFVFCLDQLIEVPGIGQVKYDMAFGGAFYAFVQANDLDLCLEPKHTQQLIASGMAIKNTISNNLSIKHPFQEDLNFLYGTIFISPPADKKNQSRNVCIFANGEVDRSPTGTGVSARLAIHHARGEIALGERITIESIIGTTFTGRIVKTLRYGPREAVIPEIEGQAFITGINEFLLDPQDPLRHGFLIR
jgi:trans-L-3-hydroxyproline dehydratase